MLLACRTGVAHMSFQWGCWHYRSPDLETLQLCQPGGGWTLESCTGCVPGRGQYSSHCHFNRYRHPNETSEVWGQGYQLWCVSSFFCIIVGQKVFEISKEKILTFTSLATKLVVLSGEFVAQLLSSVSRAERKIVNLPMHRDSSWEANSSSPSQEIPSILWNPKDHYCVH